MSSMVQLYGVLQKVVVSEKASRLNALNQLVFYVSPDATKKQVADAVELVMQLKVKSVRTVNAKQRRRGHKGRLGRVSVFKKAYVCLHPGQSLESVGESYGVS